MRPPTPFFTACAQSSAKARGNDSRVLFAAPSDFNLNKALLTAWVSTSAQQQQIVGTGTATDQQRDSMACAYPAYADVRRPCYVYSDKLDPRETYYVWVRNQNG